MPDPYREPMPQPKPPGDPMRVVLIVAGCAAFAIASTGIALRLMERQEQNVAIIEHSVSVREAGSAAPALQDFPLVSDDSDTPADFDVTYTSPDSLVPSYTVTVDARGKATMKYISREGVIATLPPDDVRTLWHLVSRHQFFKWRTDLTNDNPGMTDHFPMGLASTANGKQNAIRCLDRCPTGTGEIVDFIYKHTKPLEWAIGGKELPSKAAKPDAGNDLNSLLDTR